MRTLRNMAVVLLMALLAGCATTAADDGAVSDENLLGARAVGSAERLEVISQIQRLDDVEPQVLNVVAEYDHHSMVDAQLLEMSFSRTFGIEANKCLVARGEEPQPVVEMPDRNDPILWANLQFPYIEGLERDGFPNIPGTPAQPEDFLPIPTQRAEVLRLCDLEAQASLPELTQARALSQSLSGQWWKTVEEIEKEEILLDLTEDFGACVLNAGVPYELTEDVGNFFGYVDSQIRAIDDPEELALIRRDMGQLYVRCGRGLFETRQQLRAEQREVFLADHEAEVVELANLLEGLIAW